MSKNLNERSPCTFHLSLNFSVHPIFPCIRVLGSKSSPSPVLLYFCFIQLTLTFPGPFIVAYFFCKLTHWTTGSLSHSDLLRSRLIQHFSPTCFASCCLVHTNLSNCSNCHYYVLVLALSFQILMNVRAEYQIVSIAFAGTLLVALAASVKKASFQDQTL